MSKIFPFGLVHTYVCIRNNKKLTCFYVHFVYYELPVFLCAFFFLTYWLCLRCICLCKFWSSFLCHHFLFLFAGVTIINNVSCHCSSRSSASDIMVLIWPHGSAGDWLNFKQHVAVPVQQMSIIRSTSAAADQRIFTGPGHLQCFPVLVRQM